MAGIWNQLTYDANGNVTRNSRTGEDNYYVDYDAANRPIRITVGPWATTPTPTARDEFWYGPDGERLVRKQSWDAGGTQKVTWVEYLDEGRYQRSYPVHVANTEYVAKMMPAPSILYRLGKKTSGETWEGKTFLHRDHLGSVDSITIWSGEERSWSFDPFGSRRSSDWSSDATASELATAQSDLDWFTQQGFTDHEHLDRTGLIHMGGRIYDPRLGRFLQPDPVVSDFAFSQDHNRYAYAFNSPVSVIDPTGLIEDILDNTSTYDDYYCDGSTGCRRGSAWGSFPLAEGVLHMRSAEAMFTGLSGEWPAETQLAQAAPPGRPAPVVGGTDYADVADGSAGIVDDSGNYTVEVFWNPWLGEPVPISPGHGADFAELYLEHAATGVEAGATLWGAGKVAKGATTAAGRFLGPKGPIFGNSYYRGAGNSGLLNHGKVRIGWSYNEKTGRLNFSLRVGKWHSDKYWNPLSVKPPLKAPPE